MTRPSSGHRQRPLGGMCGRSRPALGMHKHTGLAAACSVVAGIANSAAVACWTTRGVERSSQSGPAARDHAMSQDPSTPGTPKRANGCKEMSDCMAEARRS
jgi:hypothetical protein